MENQELFNLKKSLVTDLSRELPQRPDPNSGCLQCNYHSIPLRIHSDNKSFLTELGNLIPTSWTGESSIATDLYFFTPEQFGISLDHWCDEDSQDCFFERDSGIVIQRDFAAKRLEDGSFVIITENKICDGFYNFLRWYLPKRLLEKQILVLHSACILDNNGEAHFFLGHSGAGKSTTTGLSKARKVLGDDMNLLQIEGEQIYAIAGAIGGLFKPDVNYDSRFPVKSFNWLMQDKVDTRREMPTPEGVSKFIASVTNVFWDTLPTPQIDFIFQVANEIFNKQSMYQLNFTKTSTFWDLIEKRDA